MPLEDNGGFAQRPGHSHGMSLNPAQGTGLGMIADPPVEALAEDRSGSGIYPLWKHLGPLIRGAAYGASLSGIRGAPAHATRCATGRHEAVLA